MENKIKWNENKNVTPFAILQGLLFESSSKIYRLFSVHKYTKTTLELLVAMPSERLPTNFQLNIFEARVSLQTLLQSLKQNMVSPGLG